MCQLGRCRLHQRTLSTGGVYDEQDNADKMIDSEKSPGVTNKDTLIAYRKHPRNAEDIGGGTILSIPYMAASKRRRSKSSNRSSASLDAWNKKQQTSSELCCFIVMESLTLVWHTSLYSRSWLTHQCINSRDEKGSIPLCAAS
jgi:hypothetical protein